MIIVFKVANVKNARDVTVQFFGTYDMATVPLSCVIRAAAAQEKMFTSVGSFGVVLYRRLLFARRCFTYLCSLNMQAAVGLIALFTILQQHTRPFMRGIEEIRAYMSTGAVPREFAKSPANPDLVHALVYEFHHAIIMTTQNHAMLTARMAAMLRTIHRSVHGESVLRRVSPSRRLHLSGVGTGTICCR